MRYLVVIFDSPFALFYEQCLILKNWWHHLRRAKSWICYPLVTAHISSSKEMLKLIHRRWRRQRTLRSIRTQASDGSRQWEGWERKAFGALWVFRYDCRNKYRRVSSTLLNQSTYLNWETPGLSPLCLVVSKWAFKRALIPISGSQTPSSARYITCLWIYVWIHKVAWIIKLWKKLLEIYWETKASQKIQNWKMMTNTPAKCTTSSHSLFILKHLSLYIC